MSFYPILAGNADRDRCRAARSKEPARERKPLVSRFVGRRHERGFDLGRKIGEFVAEPAQRFGIVVKGIGAAAALLGRFTQLVNVQHSSPRRIVEETTAVDCAHNNGSAVAIHRQLLRLRTTNYYHSG
jgi:hypothetical protein